MPTIKRFEDLNCWKSARDLVNMVYKATNESPFNRDFGLRDQIRRAAVSVMSNIAEGFNAGSDAEFMRFLSFSRRSVSETQSQSYIALDQKYMTQDTFNQIYAKANETERQVNALISYLNKSKTKYEAKEEPSIYTIDISDTQDLSDLSDI
ncbi:MAG: four helix bundle protein [Chloroflexota bacterium]|nr:four helix bundle protein [Chloroflexota bacterium]